MINLVEIYLTLRDFVPLNEIFPLIKLKKYHRHLKREMEPFFPSNAPVNTTPD